MGSPDLAPAFEISVLPFGKQKFEPLELGSRCLGFDFDDHANMADEVLLTLDNSDLSLWDDPRFCMGNHLEVSWGYRGRMTNRRQCVIVGSRGALVLQVKAHGMAVTLDNVPHPRVFENMTRAAVVAHIAREHGWGGSAFIEDSGVIYPSIVQPAVSDGKFIRALALKEGYEFFLQGGVLHFHKPKLGQQPKTTLTFRLDGRGEILECPAIEETRHHATGAITAKGIDPLTKKPFKVTGADTQTKRDGLGANLMLVDRKTQQLKGYSEDLVREHEIPSSAPTEQAAKHHVDGAFNLASQRGIKMQCSIVGDPDIVARDLLIISGIGRRFSGHWYVVQAKTRIQGTYTMALELSRNAHNGYGDMKRDLKSSASPNKQEPSDTDVELYSIDRKSQSAIGWRRKS